MKGKAITKIVLCSIVAVALTGVLLGGLLGVKVFNSLPIIEKIEELPGGFSINIGKHYNESGFRIGSAELDREESGKIREIDLNWASGSVLVKPYSGDRLILRESEVDSEAKRLRWKLENGTLTIHECKNGITLSGSLKKTLELLIPEESAALDKLECDSASAAVQIEGLTVAELDIDTASGNVMMKNCRVETLDFDAASAELHAENCSLGEFSADTASGSVTLSGSVNAVEMDTVSGSLKVETEVTPRKVEMEAVSGGCLLILPENAGFTIKKEGVSSKVNVEGFAVSVQDKAYVCGDGWAEFSFEGVSGDITIRAAER